MKLLRQSRGVLALVVILMLVLVAVPIPTAQAQQRILYFPQTGHYLRGAFLSYWEREGGVLIFGYPITEEYIRSADGRLVQYFERARFELVVEAPGRARVELGLLGREYLSARGLSFPPVPPVRSTAAVRYFPETGHTIRGAFKHFWERRGALPIFGYPLSEEILETLPNGVTRTVQYFERARFELRGSQVDLGLLGTFLAPCQLRAGLPPNAPPAGPLPEGDSAPCEPLAPAVTVGLAYPDPADRGQLMGFEARGYQPNETVSLWFNLPNGTVRPLPYQATAAGDGVVLIGFRTEAGDPPGRWSIVGQGLSSGHQVIAFFTIR